MARFAIAVACALSAINVAQALVLNGKSKALSVGPAPSATTSELTEWVFPEDAEPSGI